jgi:hypothetical protein
VEITAKAREHAKEMLKNAAASTRNGAPESAPARARATKRKG